MEITGSYNNYQESLKKEERNKHVDLSEGTFITTILDDLKLIADFFNHCLERAMSSPKKIITGEYLSIFFAKKSLEIKCGKNWKEFFKEKYGENWRDFIDDSEWNSPEITLLYIPKYKKIK